MTRSEINALIREAQSAFTQAGWTLPPHPRWDVTDFGLGNIHEYGLVLVNLAEEPEYCEKLMFARRGMTTPAHTHRVKKEDIISRAGTLAVTVWQGLPPGIGPVRLRVNGEPTTVESGSTIQLPAGQRVTLTPGIYHAFVPSTEVCVIGEVSTANDDAHDNVFASADVGRFPEIDEDEPPIVRLVSDPMTTEEPKEKGV